MQGPLKNAKHEAVAQAYFTDPARVGWKAYQGVYPNSSQHAAETAFSRLLKNAEFSARLEALNAAVAQEVTQKVAITVESLTGMLLDDRNLARELKQPGSAVSAVEKIAKLHGLMIDKKEIRSGNILDDANPDELAKLRELLDGGASSGDPGAGRPSDRPKPH